MKLRRPSTRLLFAILLLTGAFTPAIADSGDLAARLPAWAVPLLTEPRLDQEVLQTLVGEERARVVILFRLPQAPNQIADPELAEIERRDAIRAVADDLLLLLPAGEFELVHRYVAVRALAGEITLYGLDRLLQDPRVEGVAGDAAGSGHLSEAVPLVTLDDVQSTYALTGAGRVVAVLDSGYDSDHADLSDDLVGERCFCSDSGAGCCPNGSTQQSGAGSAEDDHGHGTNVSGIITSRGSVAPKGGAPDADIVAVKVLDEFSSFCCSSDIVAGLDWIIANRPDVDLVNMSLGTFARFSGACDSATTWIVPWAEAIDTLRSRGVLSFASSGNERDKSMLPVPACIANTIAVGAVWDSNFGTTTILGCTDATAADKVTCWSNSNTMVDVFAPGAPTTSTGLGGAMSTFFGTSQASPLAASCAALLEQGAPHLTHDEIETLLEGSTTMVTDSGNGLSFPRVDCLEAWEPCGHPLVEELDGYAFTGTESIDACDRIIAVDTTVTSSAAATLTSGRSIALGSGVSVDGELTLGLNPAWAITP